MTLSAKPHTRRRYGYILDDHLAFVRHPHVRGFWLQVHPCVVLVACPTCKMEPGHPCMHRKKIGSTCHAARRGAMPQDWPTRPTYYAVVVRDRKD